MSQAVLMRVLSGMLSLPQERTHTPMAAEEFAQLPRRVIASNDNPSTCAVCLEQLAADQTVIDLTCSHTFHEQCLANWFQRHNTCPMCRRAHGTEPAQDNEDDIQGTTDIPPVPRMRLTLLPSQITISFVFLNNLRITIDKDPYHTSLVDVFQFLTNFSQVHGAAETVIVNLNNPVQCYRTSQSFQYLSMSLVDHNIMANVAFNVYSL